LGSVQSPHDAVQSKIVARSFVQTWLLALWRCRGLGTLADITNIYDLRLRELARSMVAPHAQLRRRSSRRPGHAVCVSEFLFSGFKLKPTSPIPDYNFVLDEMLPTLFDLIFIMTWRKFKVKAGSHLWIFQTTAVS
jgi:hypothetical protein